MSYAPHSAFQPVSKHRIPLKRLHSAFQSISKHRIPHVRYAQNTAFRISVHLKEKHTAFRISANPKTPHSAFQQSKNSAFRISVQVPETPHSAFEGAWNAASRILSPPRSPPPKWYNTTNLVNRSFFCYTGREIRLETRYGVLILIKHVTRI